MSKVYTELADGSGAGFVEIGSSEIGQLNLIPIDTTVRNALTIPGSDTVIIFNSDTNTLQTNIGGKWYNLNASGLIKKQYTVGISGVAGCDYNFTNPDNQTQQSIQLGGATIIGASSPIEKIILQCLIAPSIGGGNLTMTANVGKTSGTDEYLSSVPMAALNAINSAGQSDSPLVTASSVYFSLTPSGNWSALTLGKWQITIFSFDV